MEKRKFKINILDFVIFVVILCSVAVLVFRDTINEVFTKPEISVVEVTFKVDGPDNLSIVRNAFMETVVFFPDTKEELSSDASFSEFKAEPGSLTVPMAADVSIKISGYKRLGRFYTYDGTRIYLDNECAVVIGEERIVGKIVGIRSEG